VVQALLGELLDAPLLTLVAVAVAIVVVVVVVVVTSTYCSITDWHNICWRER
jgi:hypothetical protein